MTTATYYTGVGLAIPAKTAYEAARRIVAGDGPEARALLGITLVDPDLARALLSPNTKGIIVSDALVGGPAQIAGIVGTSRDPATGRPVIGDVILRIDGVPVEDAKDVAEALAFAQKRLLLLGNSSSRSAGSSGSGGEFRFTAKVVVTVQKADGSVRDLRVYLPDAGSATTGK
jgi:S1-C subfamily serine protease